ncbi:coiled-coil domain-containing protein 17 isoform X3 [Numida meleagris]|uniref:coiled-coil domain-containing protein 17 isoform X3 n=1 Tax=Numida meleagris TaxID=8996 RepID=UPI000B3DC156|nr:coiled-coil domain-containing protein 17 isoform X3 [Numida meleagris]XP_021261274.1 coiled-coil domain-containing protein 17 isoform X3 [Numida meleagris]
MGSREGQGRCGTPRSRCPSKRITPSDAISFCSPGSLGPLWDVGARGEPVELPWVMSSRPVNGRCSVPPLPAGQQSGAVPALGVAVQQASVTRAEPGPRGAAGQDWTPASRVSPAGFCPEGGPFPLGPQFAHILPRAALHFDALLPPVGPLAAEARALRLSYLRAGGHDEATLARLLDFQLEATALEKRAVEKMSKHQPQHRAQGQDPVAAEAARGLDAALLAVELENQRLESELLALKVRREMRADAGSLAARQHTEELAQLQAKVEMLLRRQAEGMRPCLPSAVLPPPVAPPLPPALALAEPLRPTLRTGSPAAPSHLLAPSSLPSIPFGALDDPPPGQEAPAQHKHPQRHLPRYI